MICADILFLEEKDYKDMKIKFGHRKKMMGEISKLNRFANFLKTTGLESHKEELL